MNLGKGVQDKLLSALVAAAAALVCAAIDHLTRKMNHEMLYPHLLEIDEEAQNYLDTKMATAAGVTEELKTHDQMAWVGRMNDIRTRVEEFILTDLIYC